MTSIELNAQTLLELKAQTIPELNAQDSILTYFQEVLGVKQLMVEGERSGNDLPSQDLSENILIETSSFLAKRFLVIHEIPFLSPRLGEARELLGKMIEALKWSDEDYSIHEMESFSSDEINQQIQNFSGEHIFIFSAEAAQKLATQAQTHSLSSPLKMILDPSLKRNVWNQIKPFQKN